MLIPTRYIKRYGIAIAAVLIALLLMLALDPVLQLTESSFLLFFGAVTITAYYSGRSSGCVATLLAAAFANYFFIDVQYSWTVSLAGGLRLTLFILEGFLISAFVGSLRRAQCQLQHSFQQLKKSAAEVKSLNQILQSQVDELESLAAAKLASEDRYRLLIESIDEGFCLCEILLNEAGAPVDYRFLEVNPVFEGLTGLQEPVGKTARELVPGLEAFWFETYGRVALDRQPLRFEQQSVPMQRWFDVYAFPFGEPQRHLFGILFRNITARKNLEQERERFLTVGSDLQVITGRNGYFQWVSPSFERVLGWTAAEITARPWAEFVHPDDVDSSALEAENLFAGNETFAFENRYRHQDGSYRWLLWRAQSDSAQQTLYGAAVDITDTKRRAAHATFLTEIAMVFSHLASASEIMQTVGAKVGAYLALTSCAFAEINATETEAIVHYAWQAEDTPNLMGTHCISDFVTEDFHRAVRNQETVVVQNIYTDPRTAAERYAALNISSFVSVPCHQNGQWKFLLQVCDAMPRPWRDDEIELIRDLAHQIFPRLERARAEAALRESEARFKGFAKNSHDVIWITDADEYRLVYVSPSFEQVWGRPATELYTNLEQFIEFIHPDDRERIQLGWQQCTQTAFTQEYRILRPDGTIVWIRDRGFPIYDDQGNLLWIGGIAEDISERKHDEAIRKQVEEALQQREAELRLVTNAVPSLISFVDSEQRYRFNNHTYEDWFGKPVATTYGKHLREVLGEAAYTKIRPHVEQVLAGQQVTYESELPYQDGGARYVNVTYVPRFNHQGMVAGFVALVNDISDRKQTEEALRNSAARLSLALTAAKMGDWSWHATSDIVTFSEQAAAMFGIPPGPHLTWTQMRHLLHPDDRERARLQVEQAIANHSDYDIEYRVIRADGQLRWIAAKGRAQYNSSGKALGMLGVVQDITPRKQTEEEREQLLTRERTARAQAEAANRVKDEFLAVVSHELRSPLNPILGWSKLLRRGRLDEQKTQYALEVIERNTQIQAQLINDLLDVSRILRGKLSLRKRAVNLETVIQAALETVRLAVEAKSIQLQTVLEPDMGAVSGDIDRLQQVVWNLLSNAVKFTPSGGRVEVRLESIQGERVGEWQSPGDSPIPPPADPPTRPLTYAQLTIRDTGRGIDPDFLPHVFDRFRQESTTTTREFGGLGLGLALVRYLVELHGGSVQADSPGEDQGATFIVKLPLLPQSNAIPPAVEPSRSSTDLQGVQILMVDDDASTLEFMVFLLELHGASVIAAASADEAIAALAEFTPDILLSDIGMPSKDGYTLMRQVRTLPQFQGHPLPAIALTAYAGEIDYQQAMAAGFQKHMPKPIEPEQLIAVIAALVKPD